MKKYRILLLTLLLVMFLYNISYSKTITTDYQSINVENDNIINAIFKLSPLDSNNYNKIYFKFSHIDKTLNIYNSNEPLISPICKLDFKDFGGGTIYIKQFYDINNNILFFGITNNNYLFFNKYNYLIAIDKNNKYQILCNPIVFKDLYNKNKPSVPMFQIFNENVALKLVNLAGKRSREYVFTFQYDDNKDNFNIIDKGLIYFDFDMLRRINN